MSYENSEDTGLELLYRDKKIDGVLFEPDVIARYNAATSELELNELITEKDWGQEFNIPPQYKQIDVGQYIRQQLPPTAGPEYYARVDEELALYKAKNLFPLLQLMIYIVDALKEHECVYGVGRGSSVASYCLYLIGIHRIDSVKYDLDIKEFLK